MVCMRVRGRGFESVIIALMPSRQTSAEFINATSPKSSSRSVTILYVAFIAFLWLSFPWKVLLCYWQEVNNLRIPASVHYCPKTTSPSAHVAYRRGGCFLSWGNASCAPRLPIWHQEYFRLLTVFRYVTDSGSVSQNRTYSYTGQVSRVLALKAIYWRQEQGATLYTWDFRLSLHFSKLERLFCR